MLPTQGSSLETIFKLDAARYAEGASSSNAFWRRRFF
jgi:hypothetical protein